MKRCIFIEIFLILTIGILIVLCVSEWGMVSSYNDSLNTILKYGSDSMQDFIDIYNQQITKHSIYAVLSIVACITNLIAIILIAIKDFPIFKPLLEKVATHKQTRLAVKKKRQIVEKQLKLEKLQAEIDNLKDY